MTFLMQGVAGVRGFARDGCCSCALSLATPCRQMHVFAKRKKNPPRERKKVPARHHTSYVSRPRLNRTVGWWGVGSPLPGGVLSPTTSWIGSAAGCARRLHREAGADFLVVHAMGAVSSTQLRSPAPVPTARLRRRSFVKSQYQQQQTPLGEQQGGRSSSLSATPKRKGAETPPTSPARARDGVLAVQRISFTDTPLLGGVESSPSGRQVQRVNSIRRRSWQTSNYLLNPDIHSPKFFPPVAVAHDGDGTKATQGALAEAQQQSAAADHRTSPQTISDSPSSSSDVDTVHDVPPAEESESPPFDCLLRTAAEAAVAATAAAVDAAAAVAAAGRAAGDTGHRSEGAAEQGEEGGTPSPAFYQPPARVVAATEPRAIDTRPPSGVARALARLPPQRFCERATAALASWTTAGRWLVASLALACWAALLQLAARERLTDALDQLSIGLALVMS